MAADRQTEGRITALVVADQLGISTRKLRRLLREWRKVSGRDKLEPPWSQWEWDPTDPDEARALEEAMSWLESRLGKKEGKQNA